MKRVENMTWRAGTWEMHHWLFVSALFSIFLLLCRMVMTHQITYAFLVWNLFLAWIPYSITNWLGNRPGNSSNKLRLGILIFLWLLFMPNSFYIITDLFHLDDMAGRRQWFDLTLILSFAWTGILLGILSIRKMEKIVARPTGKFFSAVLVGIVMWLNAFGIYIGRYLRFNSWDVFMNPFSLFNEIFSILFDPFDHRGVWAMTSCFSFFMFIIYYTISKLNETQP